MVSNICVGCNQQFGSRQKRKFCGHSCYAKTLVGRKLTPNTRKKISEALCGRVCTEESRAKISKALKGKTKIVNHDGQFKKGQRVRAGAKMSIESRIKISLAKIGVKNQKTSGSNHWNWKGGVQHITKNDILRSEFRRLTQPLVFQRDDYTCQICNVRGGYLQVDHIKPWAKNPEARFDTDNCRTLCMACHYYVTYKRKMPRGIVWGHGFSRRIAS